MATTYLVTGGAGFIGSAAVRRLLACHEARVAVADILSYCANPLSLQEMETDPRLSFYKADVADEATAQLSTVAAATGSPETMNWYVSA